MFRSRGNTTSQAKAARELERQIMTMEVVSGDEAAAAESPAPSQSGQDVALPDRLCFGPYGIAPLTGLHYDAEKDTATS
jgi:hypothetical protein